MWEIKKVYKADNGDIFFIHNSFNTARSTVEIQLIMEEARKRYNDGNYDNCYYKTDPCPAYYTGDNKLIGCVGTDINPRFSINKTCIYLQY